MIEQMQARSGYNSSGSKKGIAISKRYHERLRQVNQVPRNEHASGHERVVFSLAINDMNHTMASVSIVTLCLVFGDILSEMEHQKISKYTEK